MNIDNKKQFNFNVNLVFQHFRNEHCITIIYENVNYLNNSHVTVDNVNAVEETLNDIYNKENLFSFKSLITWIYIDGKLNFENHLRASCNIGCKVIINYIFYAKILNTLIHFCSLLSQLLTM